MQQHFQMLNWKKDCFRKATALKCTRTMAEITNPLVATYTVQQCKSVEKIQPKFSVDRPRNGLAHIAPNLCFNLWTSCYHLSLHQEYPGHWENIGV